MWICGCPGAGTGRIPGRIILGEQSRMAIIHILDSETIDKIAAGEVVERPSSVVKELVENAVDAGASAVTVEARDGGIEFIRVTDNGCGMEAGQLRTAFLRHATSKIESASDLTRISSLGFRGEALSSIAAVAKAEVITRTSGSITGSRIQLEGAREIAFDEIGAPEGTTFLVRNLFFNTPVRRKFLKQPATEGGYIADLMEHLALSRPDISFRLVLNGQMKFHTSGNGDLKEVIYRIYGRDVANALIPIQVQQNGVRVEGYLGKPVQVRSNRNFEIYFINGRFIRSNVVARAVEEGYKEYLMQHKFPLCVLHIAMDPDGVDVNVHPTKMDVRFSDAMGFCRFLTDAVRQTLQSREMIPEALLSTERELRTAQTAERREREKQSVPEPFETKRSEAYRVAEEARYTAEQPRKKEFLHNPVWERVKGGNKEDGNPAEDLQNGPVTAENSQGAGRIGQETLENSPEAGQSGQETAWNGPETAWDRQGAAGNGPEAAENGEKAAAEQPMQNQNMQEPQEEPKRAEFEDESEDFFTETSEIAEDQLSREGGSYPEQKPSAELLQGFGETNPNLAEQPGASRQIPEEQKIDALQSPEEGNSSGYGRLQESEQLNLFEEKILTRDNRSRFRIIGQVFETYWLIEFEEKLLMIDQHAAHEKVNYERLMKRYREKNILSQGLLPPIIVSLSGQEESVLREHLETFAALGFEVEAFGGSEYALRSVPVDLYGCNEREMFLEVLDSLLDGTGFGSIRVIEEKIASMSCKAAVKGNHKLSVPEAEALIDELLTLDNPYNCPHGRPTIIAMTKAEMERKFKRIVN